MTRNVLQRPLRTVSAAGLATAVLLTACRTVPPPAVPPEGPVSVLPAASQPIIVAAPRPSLAEEQRRLATLFRGTPVGFTMQPDGSLRVNIPLRYCFDAGQFTVKAPLGAVLEQLALSQEDSHSRIAVSVPGNATALRGKVRRDAHLGHQRALGLRDYLSNLGVAESRVTILVLASGAGVSVVVTAGPEP